MSATVLQFPPLMTFGQRVQQTPNLSIVELPPVPTTSLRDEPGFDARTLADYLDPTEALIAFAMQQRESGAYTLH